MKKRLWLILALIGVALFALRYADNYNPSPGSCVQDIGTATINPARVNYAIDSPGNWVNTETGEFAITYATFDDHPVTLRNKGGRLVLSVLTDNPFCETVSLAFLKQEVERLMSLESEGRIGATGYQLDYWGGRRISAPFTTAEKIGVVKHIYFANTVGLTTTTGTVINTWGSGIDMRPNHS